MAAHTPSRPLSTRGGPPAQAKDDRKELMLNLQALWRLDFGFVFANLKADECLPLIESSLKVLQSPRDDSIQASTLRTFGAMLAKLNNPLDEHLESVKEWMYHCAYVHLSHPA
jgi:hypothetical protein